jgi:hypothetical protein
MFEIVILSMAFLIYITTLSDPLVLLWCWYPGNYNLLSPSISAMRTEQGFPSGD